MKSLTLVRYMPHLQSKWDECVQQSRNATFLFDRGFMDYHRDRFCDCSLLWMDDSGRAHALFPACSSADGTHICSHAGLTYGGLLLRPSLHTADVLRMYEELTTYYRSLGADRLNIKIIPQIYHRQPSEEEVYALFRQQARLVKCAISSTLHLHHPPALSTLRTRKVRKAVKSGVRVLRSNDFAGFWVMLSLNLQQHQVSPVHSLAEIELLAARFPQDIQLFVAVDAEGMLLAGTVLFLTSRVVHAQYIASSPMGRACGALDFLFATLIHEQPYSRLDDVCPLYFDFGISTEDGGHILNEGLLFQKEGFGATGVVYQEYELSLS